ncbi:unnamed protein product, partial [Durusdinium trenchii]
EAYYLLFVLFSAGLALMLVPNKNLDGRSHVAFQLNRLMALLVLMKVYVSVIDPAPLKPFYAQGDNRTFTRTRPSSDDSLAQRVLQQLEVYMTRLSVRREVGLFHRQVFSIMLLPLLFLQLYCINYFEAASLMFYPVIVFSGLFIGYVVCQEVPVIVTRRRTLTKVKNLLTYVLEQCDDTEMREVYLRANLASIFQATRYEVHELLVESALRKGLLDKWSKAMLLNGMQKYGINGRRNEYVADLILSCRDEELTDLKSILDSTGDYNCLFKLIYNDLRSSAVRQKVLYHIAKEAHAARMINSGAVGIKVLSDIDDTLLCSGGHFPAGCDDRIPKHMVYPGALQLFRELDRSWTPEDPCCNLALLSARPHVYKDISESKSFAKFNDLFFTGRLHCVPTLLPGSLSLGLWAVVKALFIAAHGWRDVGERKAKMFEQYKAPSDVGAGSTRLPVGRYGGFRGRRQEGCETGARWSWFLWLLRVPNLLRGALPKPPRARRRCRWQLVQLPLARMQRGAACSLAGETPQALYGEYDFIFFGDNGQGDLLAGQLLVNAEKENMQAQSEDEDSSDGEPAKSFGFCCCRRKKADRTWTWKRGQGPQLKAVMIHEVLPDEQSLSLEPLDQRTVTWRQQLEASGIFFFTSYPDAALKLHQRHPNLISIRQLRSVIEAAITDFDHDRKFLAEWEDWGHMEAILHKDIQRACEVVAAGGDPCQLVFKETEELFQQDATSLTRRRTFLRGIQKRVHPSATNYCIEEETVTEDSEATGSRSDVSVDSWFHTRGWVRAATSIGFDHLGPQPALMRRIGSAWKEIQAMNHNDAL